MNNLCRKNNFRRSFLAMAQRVSMKRNSSDFEHLHTNFYGKKKHWVLSIFVCLRRTNSNVFFSEMDVVNVNNNNVLLPDPSRLQDPTFLPVVFLMTLLTSIMLELLQIIGKIFCIFSFLSFKQNQLVFLQ